MELDESHRHELHDSLQAALGARPAATLMAHLPPAGWADLATKHDLEELERRIDLRFEQVDLRFEQVEMKFDMRFEQVDRRFVDIDRRLADIDRRLSNAEAGHDNLGTRITDLAVGLHKDMNRQTMALMFGLGSLIVTMSGVIAAALYFSSG